MRVHHPIGSNRRSRTSPPGANGIQCSPSKRLSPALLVVVGALGALGALFALLPAGSAAAAQPSPEIERGHELSCSGAKARLGVTVSWQKANRSGKHTGHAAALVKGENGAVQTRKVSSKALRSVRSQSIDYRFRFPKRASKRLCKGNATAELAVSHGHNKDQSGLVEIYRVARKTLVAKRSARPNAGATGQEGSDCRLGGKDAFIYNGAQLQNCDLSGLTLKSSQLRNAALDGASLDSSNLKTSDLTRATLTGATLTSATLTSVNFFFADLTDAILTGATLTLADCSGTTLPDGSVNSASGFIQCAIP